MPATLAAAAAPIATPAVAAAATVVFLDFPRSQPFRVVLAVCLGGTFSTIKQGLNAGTIY